MLLAFTCAACARMTGSSGPAAAPVRLNVYAAASLVEAFGEIGSDFEQTHPGTQVLFNFAGSQQLAQQIVLGAPADVFASANLQQMNVVIEQGMADRQEVRTFATNHLVVAFALSEASILNDLRDLAQPGLKIVLAAPEVPAGAYALSFLDLAAQSPDFGPSFRQGVVANVVSQEENVLAVLSKVELGEADAGIVYASDAASAPDVGTLQIPPDLSPAITYPIVVLRQSPNAGLARAFADYVLSPEGAAVLARHGFGPAEK